MKTPWSSMTGGDWLVVVLLLSAALAGMVWAATAPSGTRIVVTSNGRTCYSAPLDRYDSVDLPGPLGPTHLIIDSRGARISDSPCPRKVCVAMGVARHTGDLLACIPNRILVRVEGSAQEERSYDLLSR